MRTTTDLPDPLYARVRDYARQQNASVSQTVAALVRKGMESVPDASHFVDPTTGLVVFEGTGRTLTSADVADLVDEDA
ncbi:MAG: hypothetical protein FWF02_01375 [Micrococcales bacterium]|nr:hypothetical protein [Micrococcales bacterium]MCL2666345.1 hypothetical protein [Micrococcales bacterium]